MNLYDIYENLKNFIQARKWLSVEDFLQQDEFWKQIRVADYIKVSGVNRYNQKTTIILTSEQSNIPNHKNDFVKVIGGLTGEIILISNKVLTTSIREYANSVNILLYSFTFEKFLINMMKAPLVPPHRLLSKEEANLVLQSLHKEAKHLPGISVNDTQAIWIGARLGDIVEIKRYVESTGTSLFYRHCIP